MKTRFAPAVVFVAAFLFRWLTLDFDNDYFMHVAWANQMLHGELPVGDFVEPGFILQTLLSYAGLRIGGSQLLWEAVVACGMIAAGIAALYQLCRRLAVPRLLTATLVVFAAAMFPRLYAYPKALVYPAALLALLAYLVAPGRRALIALGAVTAAAFLFRHDHGAWIAVTVAASLAIVHAGEWTTLARSVAIYGATSAALAAPLAIWVAASGQAGPYMAFLGGQGGGLITNRIVPDRVFDFDRSAPIIGISPVRYPVVGIRWAASASAEDRRVREAKFSLAPAGDEPGHTYVLSNVSRANVTALLMDPAIEDTSRINRSTARVPTGAFAWTWLQLERYFPLVRIRLLPGLIKPANALAWVTWVTFVAPWLVLAAALTRRRMAFPALSPRVAAAFVVPAAALSIVTYQTLVRGSPDSRLGDVAPITAVMLACACGSIWAVGGRLGRVVRAAAAIFIVLTVCGAVSYSRIVPRLSAGGVDGPTGIVRHAYDVGVRYASRPLDIYAPEGTGGVAGLGRWLNTCTHVQDRVALVGFEPQLFVIAERGFAGGLAFYDLAWQSSPADQVLAVQRWSRQSVPAVIAMDYEWNAFSRDYPAIRAFIDSNYDVAQHSAFGGNKPMTLLLARSNPPAAAAYGMGLPCFADRRATR